MYNEKVLLITTDDNLEDTIKSLFSELGKEFPIIKVNDISQAVERILSNGFTMTILDVRSFSVSNTFIDEIINLNYIARKKLVLLTNRNYNARLERIFHDELSECPIVNVYGNNIKEKIQYHYVNMLSKVKPKSHKEMTDSLISDIKEIKSSKLYDLAKHFSFFVS
jgi:hypothetical protein